MEKLLIIADLSKPDPAAFTYGTGLENWVRTELPDVFLLDLDGGSDKTFAMQIRDCLQEAKKAVLWLKSEKSESGLGVVAPLVEFVIRNPEKCLLLLQGNHLMIERMGKAAKGNFMSGGEDEVKQAVREYLGFSV